MRLSKKAILMVAGLFLAAGLLSPAYADIKQIKAYKEAYPDSKPKCIHCHVLEKPKKDDGQHDPNEYGKKVKAIKEVPDAAAYTKAGPGAE